MTETLFDILGFVLAWGASNVMAYCLGMHDGWAWRDTHIAKTPKLRDNAGRFMKIERRSIWQIFLRERMKDIRCPGLFT